MFITQANSSNFGRGDAFILNLAPSSFSAHFDDTLEKVATFFSPKGQQERSESALSTSGSDQPIPAQSEEVVQDHLLHRSYATQAKDPVQMGQYLNIQA